MKPINPERLLACLSALQEEARLLYATVKEFDYSNAVTANNYGFAEGISYAVDELIATLSLQEDMEELSRE